MILFVIGQRNSNGTSTLNCSSVSGGGTGVTSRTWEVAEGGLGGAVGSGGCSTVSEALSGRGPGR